MDRFHKRLKTNIRQILNQLRPGKKISRQASDMLADFVQGAVINLIADAKDVMVEEEARRLRLSDVEEAYSDLPNYLALDNEREFFETVELCVVRDSSQCNSLCPLSSPNRSHLFFEIKVMSGASRRENLWDSMVRF
jgi:histone H3/H4